MEGKIHSIESFGTVDGPGIRYVIFFQGCPLRCAYCHNPDSWDIAGGVSRTVNDLVEEAIKYKNYFKNNGGVTLTGGEPLYQFDFCLELIKALKQKGIHICLDTSGITFHESRRNKFKELIQYVDLFLLDIKHIDSIKHQKFMGMNNENVLSFAKFLSENNKDMWIRHVLVPGITTDENDLIELKKFIHTLNNVKKIEVLPYHNMGIDKYNKMGINYLLKDTRTPSEEELQLAKSILINSKN